ncbi:MAG TPA: hypothetical protein VM840_03405, partial [Actinomycetota bacterium]|nr:hypothetical protein [Actinomycetota bacterium]
MLEDRLDEILRAGAEPEPEDDGFTQRVMSGVRTRRSTRHLMKPVALAAAALLVASGAAAAVRV